MENPDNVVWNDTNIQKMSDEICDLKRQLADAKDLVRLERRSNDFLNKKLQRYETVMKSASHILLNFEEIAE